MTSAAKEPNPRTMGAKTPSSADPIYPRPGTKAARILALIRRPRGATLVALQKATGWQPHSIRGFLSAIVVRRMGLKIKSIKESGHRRYSLTT